MIATGSAAARAHRRFVREWVEMASAEMSQKEIRMMKRVAMLKKEASFESQLAEGQPKRARASTDVAVEPLPSQVTSFRRQDTSIGCSLCATLDLPQCLDFEPTALRGVGLFEELCILCNHDRSVHIQPRRAKERSSKHEKSAREECGSPPHKNSSLFALDLEAVAPVGDGSPSPRRRQRLLSSPNVNFRTGRAVDALDLVAQRRAGSVPHGAGEQALAGALETRKSKAAGSGKGGYARRFLGKAKMLKQSASEERKKSRQVVDGQKTEEVPRRKSETNLKNISLAQPPGAPRKGDADTPRSREEQSLRTEVHHLQTSLSAVEKELRHTKGRIVCALYHPQLFASVSSHPHPHSRALNLCSLAASCTVFSLTFVAARLDDSSEEVVFPRSQSGGLHRRYQQRASCVP